MFWAAYSRLRAASGLSHFSHLSPSHPSHPLAFHSRLPMPQTPHSHLPLARASSKVAIASVPSAVCSPFACPLPLTRHHPPTSVTTPPPPTHHLRPYLLARLRSCLTHPLHNTPCACHPPATTSPSAILCASRVPSSMVPATPSSSKSIRSAPSPRPSVPPPRLPTLAGVSWSRTARAKPKVLLSYSLLQESSPLNLLFLALLSRTLASARTRTGGKVRRCRGAVKEC